MDKLDGKLGPNTERILGIWFTTLKMELLWTLKKQTLQFQQLI
jgi:hypothetical protein